MAVLKDEWIKLSGDESYAEYLFAARKGFEKGESATLQEVRRVYQRAADKIRRNLEDTGLGGPATRAYQELLEKKLREAAKNISKESLAAIQNGITMAVGAGTEGPKQIALDLLKENFDVRDVDYLFVNINQRALLALLSRTAQDGLKLSDRVWRIERSYRRALQKLVEDGVARGLNSRKLAREVQKYLQPGVWTAHKLETRRRLGVPKDVSYEAMRLARTELNNAFHEGMITASRATPSYEGIFWRLSGSHRVPDVCEDYAAHNGNGFWPKGEEPVRPHPQCFCVTFPAHQSPEQFADRLKNWVKNPGNDTKLETWYNNIARQFLKRPSPFAKVLEPQILSNQTLNLAQDVLAEKKNRKELARYMLDEIGLNNVPVEFRVMNDWGCCQLSFDRSQEAPISITGVVLNQGDTRPLEYRIKTIFHEITHARMYKAKSIPNDQLLWNIQHGMQYEEIIAETVANYLTKTVGITKEFKPAYSNYLVANLPRLKQLPEFVGCNTVADFGEVLVKYRYGNKRIIGWGELKNQIESQPFDLVGYAKQYEEYVKKHKDEIIEVIFEATGSNNQETKSHISQSIDRGWANYNINEPGFLDSLIIAMNRLGVK
jgi:hypothetical protein